MARLSLKDVKKSFGTAEVIRGIDLEVEHGEFVVFVGPSGCGKSTLLRMIAGLEDISSGELWIGNNLCNDIDPRTRGIAMVFQSYALYPQMTVYDNFGFSLKLAKVPKDERDRKIREAARILQMEHLLDRKPANLSGGQRQRVAIGRAIVRKPGVFLFDEPLSNLDAALRVDMRMELSKLHQELGATMIYVTHDQVEAMTLADKIVVLNGGVVQQIGSPMELYHHPANMFVAGFIGSPKMNFLEMTVTDPNDGTTTISAEHVATLNLINRTGEAKIGDKVTLGIRPHDLVLSDHGSIKGEVVLVERLGNETVVNFSVGVGRPWQAVLDGDAPSTIGSNISFDYAPDKAHLFDVNGVAV
ncbi:sn-glycerol-3-phosphate ABC transporter ATP-binding protein UgpC [Paraburkholderia dipogonis]|uniref:sn-glycerol-3-phosphate ABC transporter ATP-binding protein UgpC n=1 Tax=Paraburkholderia dipogonis TaxID=1211383 RepID=A0A4Y8MHF6_9BURK|nr:sn-glycerol-3-phosphate ABC transporter ATP-binding protein UgpC [Paraburkholderia dipogonis]TFE36871.1 sn-glycerol-3-phosphate ABC transporter ATP-binding protein UgpC [Paraburkholderia dipogonis]